MYAAADDLRVSQISGGLEQTIGNTPLIELRTVTKALSPTVRLWAKAEFMNPGGSVKDRAALAMILDGEEKGDLRPGMTILDATSGNTGIAYAMIGAARGYPVALTLPANASAERKRILKAFGAEIFETDPLEGTDGAQNLAKDLAGHSPSKYFYPDQYNNDANWRAHYETTAPEIWEQTNGGVTHFICGLGTTGTFVGTTRRLKELNPGVIAVSMQPASPLHGLEGMKHLGTAIVPGIYDDTLADHRVEVETETAYRMARDLARNEGLFVGPSAAANVAAALEFAENLSGPASLVTILCDGGERYLGEEFWDQEAPAK